jgi:hypothetical protein
MLELDHALIAVPDLGRAARELEARHGLVALEGGRHPGWGTANRIVPLGDTYIELIAVVDRDEAAGSAFGRFVAAAGAEQARPLGWAVRTHAMDEVAARLGLAVSSGSRAGRDGGTVRWRLAGVEEAAAEPHLPFIVEWAPDTTLPGRAPAAHRDAPLRIVELRLEGNAERLREWLGGASLPVSVREGAPGLAGIRLEGAAGEILLGGEPF